MIANLAISARGATADAIWDVEDEELLVAIRRHLDRRAVQGTIPAVPGTSPCEQPS
jgi:hypothetical protein